MKLITYSLEIHFTFQKKKKGGTSCYVFSHELSVI